MVCGGCHESIIGRIVSAMGMRWHPQCFKCCTCGELLEHVSSYENDGKPYCHLDYHEVSPCTNTYLHSAERTDTRLNFSSSHPDATTVKPPSSTNVSSRWTIPSLASARIMSSTSSARSAATRSFPQPHLGRRHARSRVTVNSPQVRKTMSASRCTRAIPTAKRAMCGCECRSVRNARRVSGMGCRRSKRWAGSGVGSVSHVR